MSFASGLFDFVSLVVGGSLFVMFWISAICCSLAALLALSDENRPAFRMISRIVSIVILVFGAFLPFRSLSFLPFFLAIWWALIINEVFPKFRIIQSGIAMLLSVVYWVRHVARTKDLFLLPIGDFTLFVLLPLVIVLVQLSRGAERLDGMKGDAGPVIPLQRVLGMLHEMLEAVFPVYH